jgi:hypothetical protein
MDLGSSPAPARISETSLAKRRSLRRAARQLDVSDEVAIAERITDAPFSTDLVVWIRGWVQAPRPAGDCRSGAILAFTGGRVKTSDLTAAINAEWDASGFFGQLRFGRFDSAGAGRVKKLLLAIPGEGELPRRLVALTWGIPAFMGWQRELVAKSGGSLGEFDTAVATFQNLLEQVLGVP